jgi:CRP/FNR family transcriptional regulator, cyclic AMP receptor protein
MIRTSDIGGRREAARRRPSYPGPPGLDPQQREEVCTPTQLFPNFNDIPLNTPYGIRMVDDCSSCEARQDEWFCNFESRAAEYFGKLGQPIIFPRGAALFLQGQDPRGVFVLCSGKVRLSMLSVDGRMLVLKVADPGEVLGLSAVVAGTPFELSAETATPCQVRFVEKQGLLKLIREQAEAGLNCAQALSRDFQSTYTEIRGLVMARSSTGKLARLLLSWSPPPEGGEARIQSRLTHEEIGQMIGSSRETVTRVLSQLKKRHCIRTDGNTLVICDRQALEMLAA